MGDAGLRGFEPFHNIFNGGSLFLHKGITAVWVPLNRAAQMSCLAKGIWSVRLPFSLLLNKFEKIKIAGRVQPVSLYRH